MNDNPFIMHCFMMGHTIEAAIRLYNPNSTIEERKQLMEKFLILNGDIPPKMGTSFKIPILSKDV